MDEVFWECPDCQVENADEDGECASCGAEKPRSRLFGFKAGLVVGVEALAGKDRLKAVTVRVCADASDTLTVVTAAKNVAADAVGRRVAVACVGATVGGEKVAKTSVGGRRSDGLLADGAMLGWRGGSVGLAVFLADDYPIGCEPPLEKPRGEAK